MELIATVARVERDGYCTVLAFGDSADVPERYVMLQMADHPDEQDIRLGLAGVFVELSPPPVSGYDLVEEIAPVGAGLRIRLRAGAAGPEPIELRVRYPESGLDAGEIGEAVRALQHRLAHGGSDTDPE